MLICSKVFCRVQVSTSTVDNDFVCLSFLKQKLNRPLERIAFTGHELCSLEGESFGLPLAVVVHRGLCSLIGHVCQHKFQNQPR